MKFLAVAAALVATVAAAPKENWGGWGNRGLGGWGNGGWGNGGWGGWDNGYWGLGRTVSNQEASNVCGSGNTVMCCNSFTHRNNLDSGNGVGNALDRMPGGFGPGAGSYSQCNDINILSNGNVNDHCQANTACCQSGQEDGGWGNNRPCVALAQLL